MSSQTISVAPHPTIPPDVLVFARELSVERSLLELIEWARQVYPSATKFEVFVEDDPDIVTLHCLRAGCTLECRTSAPGR